ncbi:hypothetical protein LVJ82_00800 [Vitreoscilla massiliensis]|uniref:Uncharacterized protein n=1 Tax=Vitreoscilla massiliensis TaxID=1689272 RepID=A0ABY4E148_9NEIS|nr:hypothetical protein [Vitreoscilla massiliensis]UOO89090.1 hypothetical protein LVJ82_16860 [Vitreoscilla massiliensis]UOO89554.1 hypothetical protein LVJ82_00800 [Vitreoscilla massiliensis]
MKVIVVALSRRLRVEQIAVQSETLANALSEIKEEVANYIFDDCEVTDFDAFYDKVWSELTPLENALDFRSFLSSYNIGFDYKIIEINQTIDWD